MIAFLFTGSGAIYTVKNTDKLFECYRFSADKYGYCRHKKARCDAGFWISTALVEIKYGGEGGIRTHGRGEPSLDFKSSAFGRALPPLHLRSVE